MESKIPIIAAPMNQVSDANLAIACHRAGIMPSISFLNFVDKDTHTCDFESFLRDVEYFTSSTNTNKLIISVSSKTLLRKGIQDQVVKYFNKIKFSHLEIILTERLEFTNKKLTQNDKDLFDSIEQALKSLPKVKIMYKALDVYSIIQIAKYAEFIDCYVLKSNKGAGTISNYTSNIYESINLFKTECPGKEIIASGGISTAKEIKKCIKAGAKAVAIGTLFAFAKESKISNESKKVMIQKNKNDLDIISGYQNGVVFNKLEKDDSNNTFSLIEGIKSPHKGHLFAGHGLNNITNILSVQEIVDKLWPKK